MCHFVTLIAPTKDTDAISAIMKRHGRNANPIDNPSIRMVLGGSEHQYLTTRGHCDCGTVLAPKRDTPEAREDRLAKEANRLRRLGWTEAKITRAIEDRRKSDARPSGRNSDSFELWSAVLHDVGRELDLSHVGLIVRFYSGEVATEVFSAKRRVVTKNACWQDALASLEYDEVTIFPFN